MEKDILKKPIIAVAREHLNKHSSSYLIPFISFVVFAAGKLVVASFSNSIGVRESDFQLNNLDYVLVACMNLGLWIIVVVVPLALQKSVRKMRSDCQIVGVKMPSYMRPGKKMWILEYGLSYIYFIVFTTLSGIVYFESMVLNVIVPIVLGLGIFMIPLKYVLKDIGGTVRMSSLFALFVIIIFVSPATWASTLKSKNELGKSANYFIPLSIVFQPKTVSIYGEKRSSCVQLLAGNVILKDGNFDVKDIEEFSVNNCKLSRISP